MSGSTIPDATNAVTSDDVDQASAAVLFAMRVSTMARAATGNRDLILPPGRKSLVILRDAAQNITALPELHGNHGQAASRGRIL